ncbi:MAG: EAL domain-containing protein [Roseibium sp.]
MSDSSKNIVNFTSILGRTHVDAIVISFISVILWLLAVEFDFYEDISGFLSKHEDWQLDEFIVAITLAGFGGFIFGFRRYREREHELVLRKKAEVRANWLAQHDPLTQLPNRRYLKTLSKNIHSGTSGAPDIAVLAIDLDGFKKVNDLLGHEAGDSLLKTLASRLKNAFPDSTVLRLGGDEFLVVTSASVVSVSDGWETVNELIKTLNQPVDLFGVSAEVGASIGIALKSDDTESLEDLVRAADAALYYAKGIGRNSAAFYEPSMSQALKDRATHQSNVRTAIRDKDLVPYFQPVIDLATQKLMGAEVLIRWPSRTDDTISPKEIVQIAEEVGMVIHLSEHLLREAILSAKNWPNAPSLFFNFAPTMLADKLLAQRIEKILTDASFAPERLIVEIPEAALHEHRDTAVVVLDQLKSLGVSIAVDGFGGGHCNLIELTKMPIDMFKLDRTLVVGAVASKTERAVMETYFNFAHSLGLPVVAVGVETKIQQALLREIECEFAQGFLYSQAVPDVDFVSQIQAHGSTKSA